MRRHLGSWRFWRVALPVTVLVFLVGLVLLAPEEALARVGGGQSFGSGSGGSGGGFSGGSGGGDDGLGLILYLLIRLAIEYPAVGIPLLLLFGLAMVVKVVHQNRTHRHRVHRGGGPRRQASDDPLVQISEARARGSASGLGALRERDEGFSEPVLHEFLQLVHRRSMEALGSKEWGPLAPFVAPSAREDLVRAFPRVAEVSEVVYGGIRIEKVAYVRGRTHLTAFFLGSRLERLPTETRRVYFEERWSFQRDASAISGAPEDVLRMGCPSCGAAVDTDRMGRCTHCETPISAGQLAWQANQMNLVLRRRVEPPAVGLANGGDEPSVHHATFRDPDLARAFRSFTARHPDFSRKQFEGRVRDVFLALQHAWSEGAWDQARPHVTDPMFQNLRFYMEQYAASGMANKLDDVRFERQEIVKVQLDAWYESITVRVWASMKDYVVDRNGKVIGGNAKISRRFSEYWTFLRAAGTGTGSKDAQHCPSCGAPLDAVNQAGVCGYCETRITSGRFDWVLTRIDQTEVYQG